MNMPPHPHSPPTSISSLSSVDDRRHVRSYLPPEAKMLAVAPARVYHSAFGNSSDSWSFTGLRGMLVFGRDRTTEEQLETAGFEPNYWFRLVDIDSGKGIVWFQQIPPNFDYRSEKPFFHTFSGCVRFARTFYLTLKKY